MTEVPGASIKKRLLKSNPFKEKKCTDPAKCIVCDVDSSSCHFAIAEIKGEQPYCDVANALQKCLKIRQKNALSKSAYPCLSLELCVDTTGLFR